MKLRRNKANLMICFIILILTDLIYLRYVWEKSIVLTKERAYLLADTAEVGLQSELFTELELLPDDINKTEYHIIKESLTEISERNSSIIYCYLYTRRGDNLLLIADSEPVSSEFYLAPGSEFPLTGEKYLKAFQSGEPMITKQSKNSGGNLISVLYPVKDSQSGAVTAVLGMNYEAGSWFRYARTRVMEKGLNGIILILFFIMLHYTFYKQLEIKADRNKLREMNDKLLVNERIFHALFEQAPYGITFGNNQSIIVDSNLMFHKIVGIPKEELQNLSWIEISHPEDVRKDLELFEKLKKGEIDGYQLEKRYIRPDGTIVWANVNIAPIKYSNQEAISHICMIEDITERKKAEASLKESERSKSMLLSNLPGMAYRCNYDRDWTMQFVSEGCYELTGYPPESLLYNRDITFNDLINQDYREYLWDKWTEVLQKHTVFKEEYAIITADHRIKWVFEQGQGVYNEQGEVEAIEGLIIDISKQRKREDEILFLTYHDVLTGLYNRRYYEEAKIKLDQRDKYPLSVIVGDINGLKLINSAMGHQEGDVLIQKVSRVLEHCSRPGDVLARTGGDEFSILMPNTTYEEADKIVHMIGRMCEEQRKNAPEEPYHASISVGCATKEEETVVLTNVIKAAEESMYRHKLLQNRSLHSSIISTMKNSLFEKSQETEAHAQRLITLSRTVGELLDLTEEELNQLELLSTLHDIGKIGISDNILNKPGKLTVKEWMEMKRHPEMGYRIAMSTPELAPIADYILNHHERWDGKGYPYGKKGEEIPLLSRIISIADSYDAMTSDRPYRKAMTREEAIEEIRRNGGTQFDPKLTELFLDHVVGKEN